MDTPFKDLAIGTQFYFASEKEWYALGMKKGPFIKTSARKYRESRFSHLHGVKGEFLIGTVTVRVIRTG